MTIRIRELTIKASISDKKWNDSDQNGKAQQPDAHSAKETFFEETLKHRQER
ncbi:MAG: hypothetical protein HUJ98_00240 [Bacteroidaceae bacterium]|mgnify:CR=1 FL=1|nr:hypothetical protein [Bacteroidaceae bacterium]